MHWAPWLWAALASASAMVLDMPEEGDATKLSAKKFRQRYARKGLPVVMRGTEDGPTFDEVGELCPDGAMGVLGEWGPLDATVRLDCLLYTSPSPRDRG